MSLLNTFQKSLLALSVLGLVACSGEENAKNSDETSAKQEEKKEFAIPVEVTFSKIGDVAKYYQTTAILEAEQESKSLIK